MSNIYVRLAAIMRDAGAIGKDSRNQQQGFNFRGIDAVMDHLHPIFAKHGVVILPEVLDDKSEERETKNGGHLIYRILRIKFAFVAEDGSFTHSTVIGEGMDSGDKAANKAMAVALKYALTQMLLLPYNEVDPDAESHPESVRTAKQAADKALDDLPPPPPKAILTPAPRPPSEQPTGATTTTISEPQAKRLFAISKTAGWDNDQIKAALKERFGYTSSKNIERAEYEEICTFFGKPPFEKPIDRI